MKKIRAALTALTVCLAMLVPAVPANATTNPPARTAAWLTKNLAAFEPTITSTIVYTVATDPNHYGMGRPGVYTSKSAWVDSRVPSSYIACFAPKLGDLDCGGGIEVYRTPYQANLRAEYIQWVEKGLGTDVGAEGYHLEYDFVGGSYLLRLSGALSQSAANNYARVFSDLTGTSVLPVHKTSCNVKTPVTEMC
jgi:hypothetical protein